MVSDFAGSTGGRAHLAGRRRVDAPRAPKVADWLPVVALPAGVVAAGTRLPAWAYMWALAFSMYAACKWLSWRKARDSSNHSGWRSAAYLLAWPGMDAKSFLNGKSRVTAPGVSAWISTACVTALGAAVLWVGVRMFPTESPLLQGWTGMVGFVLLVHFGIFRLTALFWQSVGIDAKPIMSAPVVATSISELWGRRWNRGFRQLAYDFVFTPAEPKLGPQLSAFLVFLLSGLIHDVVISLPARGGFGLPTLYFVLQGLGVAAERSTIGKLLGLRRGFRGWLFTAIVAVGPLFWLYHPPFVLRVILPFMRAIKAL